jgi:hypothetical protein
MFWSEMDKINCLDTSCVSVNRASFCNILFLAVATAAQDEMLIKCKIMLWPLSDQMSSGV